MKLKDKLCYPIEINAFGESKNPVWANGLTFRERLIIALASNPEVYNPKVSFDELDKLAIKHDWDKDKFWEEIQKIDKFEKYLINRADAIMKQLEAEK